MSLLELLFIFLVYTIMTFGNGPVMLPILDKELVQSRHAITSEQLLYAYAIARVTPGQVNLYIGAVGYLMFGMVGAILSSITIILPGFLMIPMLHGYKKIQEISIVSNFIKGITVTSIGLIFSATVYIGQDVLVGITPWIVFFSTIILAKVIKLNGFMSFFLSSSFGILLSFIVK